MESSTSTVRGRAELDAGAPTQPGAQPGAQPGSQADHPLAELFKARIQAAVLGEPEEQARFGRYLLRDELGSGGMGMVLEAYDEQLERSVALKLLLPQTTEREAERLVREAKALARLSHPNIVQVYDAGEVDGRWFIAMELLRGRTLTQWQASRPGWRECVRAYVQAGAGLAAAHAIGLVHRDFKPSNCIIDDEGRVRVLDFGLVREVGAPGPPSPRDASTPSSSTSLSGQQTLTVTGSVLGTLAYMPPEQLDGRPADDRSDQFGFCVSLFEALYGVRPFEAETLGELMVAVAAGRVRRVPRSGVPSRLRRIVLRGLAVGPEDRWPSMGALLARLQRLVEPRRGRWLALGVGLGLMATATAAGLADSGRGRCEGARARLDDVWDPARKREVEAAILGTGLSYASGTWERAERALDDYATAWVDAHVAVCEATRVTEEQTEEVMELRMSCLEQRRLALRERVALLATADEARVERAVDLVTSMPGLERCDDVEALRAELPPPEDPEVAARVQALREQLARVGALRDAGACDEALTEAHAVVEGAAALDYAPLRAEAWLRRGLARACTGEFEAAREDLERAYPLAAEIHHDEVEAHAAIALTSVVGGRLAQPELGRQWGMTGLALARGLRGEPGLRTDALEAIAMVMRKQGELEPALRHYQRVLELREELAGPRSNGVATSLNGIGGVLLDQGRLDEAHASYARALEIVETARGPRHPLVAVMRTNLGVVLSQQGDFDAALAHYQRALTILEDARGREHPDVAGLSTNIGILLSRRGELTAALDHHRRALASWEQALGPRHPLVAMALTNLGAVLHRQGDHAAALAHHERALEIRREAQGARHPDLAVSLANVAEESLELGEIDRAFVNFQEALEIKQEVLGSMHPTLAYPLLGLARIALRRGEPVRARAHAERAVAVREAGSVRPDELAEARFVLARALSELPGEQGRARELAERAREGFAEQGETYAGELAEVKAWLTSPPG